MLLTLMIGTLLTLLTISSALPHVFIIFFYLLIGLSDRLQVAYKLQLQKEYHFRRKVNAIFFLDHWFNVTNLIILLNKVAWFFSSLIEVYGQIVYGYEVEGFENLFDQPKIDAGGGESKVKLLIFYHGFFPLDMTFVANRMNRCSKIKNYVCIVGDRFFSDIFFPRMITKLVFDYLFPGPMDHCVDQLKAGKYISIAPGGTREALFATYQYETLWNGRKGFAKVARQAKVDIVPIFTTNIRHVFYIPRVAQKWLRSLYEYTRLPVIFAIGGFPVKLTTHIGRPIAWNDYQDEDQLARATEETIQSMIEKYQSRISNSLLWALIDRIHSVIKRKTKQSTKI